MSCRPRLERLLALALALATLPIPAALAQQTLLYEIGFEHSNAYFGSSVASLGDLDDDGTPDFLAAAPLDDARGRIDSGSVVALSGRTGAVLRRFDGLLEYDAFGSSVTGAGDLDGDGVPDFLVGAPEAGRNGSSGAGCAIAVNGATRGVLWQICGTASNEHLGLASARIGDVDGDFVADFSIGIPGRDAAGRVDAGVVLVVSGSTGAILRTIEGDALGMSLGSSLARYGDLDADGTPDVLAGGPTADEAAGADAGSVRIYSGRTGVVLRRFDGPEAGMAAGASVAGLPDLDHDGVPDFLVGAPHARVAGMQDRGSVFVVSGATGAVQQRIDGAAAGDAFGSSVALLGDVDGDHVGDFAVGAPRADGALGFDVGRASVYSGATLSLLFAVEGLAAGDRLGSAVTNVGDVTGDGRHDLVIGAPLADPASASAAGTTYLIALDPVLSALAGRVNAGGGARKSDVLFVNGSAGGAHRAVTLDRQAPLQIAMGAPPSRRTRPSRFVLYAWIGWPSPTTLSPHPLDLGSFAFSTPINKGPWQPREIFNNLGHARTLGTATQPSSPAPSTVASLPGGAGRAAIATIQALIKDDNASNTLGVSITNGIRLRID